MATVTTFVDDLDGSTETVQTRSFALGKTQYAIDLSDENYRILSKLLEPYIRVAAVVGTSKPSAHPGETGRSARQTAGRSGSGKVAPVYGSGKAIRDFAESIGAKVPYARPTNELVRQWVAAHPDETRAWEAQTGRVALDHYA